MIDARTSAVAASTIPTQASATPTRSGRAPVRYPADATRSWRASRASNSASVAGISPPRKNPVTAAMMPSASTLRALLDATGSGSSGCRSTDMKSDYKAGAPATDRGGRSRNFPSAERSQIKIIQGYRMPAGRAEPVVGLRVPGHRVHLLLGLLGRLHPDVAVLADAGTSRDELADDHVLLEADQRVAAGVDRRVRQYPGGLLERRRRRPARLPRRPRGGSPPRSAPGQPADPAGTRSSRSR